MNDLTFAPAPAAAPAYRRVAAQALAELRSLLRNGEQLLLTLVIPVLILGFLTLAPVVTLGPGRRVDFLTPGVFALAVMSTAFTGQAISTGFERRYGVLKRLGATPLGRTGLLLGKTSAVLTVEVFQLAVLGGVAAALGWRPHGSAPAAVALLALGTAAFSGLGLLMAGRLRAEATLAAANLVYLVLLALGGVMFPLSRLPTAVRMVADALPTAALADGLRAALQPGGGLPAGPAVVLTGWAVLALAAAALTFRWE